MNCNQGLQCGWKNESGKWKVESGIKGRIRSKSGVWRVESGIADSLRRSKTSDKSSATSEYARIYHAATRHVTSEGYITLAKQAYNATMPQIIIGLFGDPDVAYNAEPYGVANSSATCAIGANFTFATAKTSLPKATSLASRTSLAVRRT